MTERKLSKADKRKLKELRADWKHAGQHHPAYWYGVEPPEAMAAIIADERARIEAEAKAITDPEPEVPVLVGVVVENPTLF